MTDAARIARAQPGRAFARVGQAELTEFQSAYVGGITMISTDGPPIELRDFRFGPPPDAPAPARSSTAYGTVATDLEELVKAVNEAAEMPAAAAAAVAVAAGAGADRAAGHAWTRRAIRSRPSA